MKTRLLCLAAIILLAASVGFAQGSSGIRKVDFKNFNYGTLCPGPHQFLGLDPSKLILRNGRQGDEWDYNELRSVEYADLNRDGRDEAFVVVKGQTSGSSNGYLSAYVFGFERGRARQLWSKCEEGSAAELRGRNIIFTSPEWLKNDAHCCFSNILTRTYGWKAGKFTLLSTKRRKSSDEQANPGSETIEEFAARVSAAFGAMGTLDDGKPHSGRVSVIIENSISGDKETKSFANYKQAEDWLTRRSPEAGRNAGGVERCADGTCTFVQEGMLHNNLYLTRIDYSEVNGRPMLKTIYIVDGN